jgi:hypothetical protein
LRLPGARFVLVVSPELSRGFSGEGAVLDNLLDDAVTDDAGLIGTTLAFQPRVSPICWSNALA